MTAALKRSAPDHEAIAPVASEPLVRFVDVQKTYDGATLVVRNLNLAIRRGEFLTLLGPSGSGKTTTLMMLAGFEQPTRGEIFLDGVPIGKLPAHKRGIGMVFQSYALFPHMTSRRISPSRWKCAASRSRRSAGGSSAPCAWSSWMASARAGRTSCPAGSSSVSRWRGRWCSSRASS